MWRRLLALCTVLVLLAVGVLIWLRLWGRPAFDAFPPGALDNYLPPDTAAVVSIDLRELRDKGVLDKPLGKELHEALTADELGLPFRLLGVDPAADVDTVRLAFSARDHGRPLVFLRGRFDRGRFQTGPGQLEEFRQDGFRLYRFKDAGREITLAQAGDTLVAGLVRQRVVAALRCVSGKGTATLNDERLKAILDKVDRNRAVWLAANLARLGAPMMPREIAAPLRPVFEETEGLWGGVVWGEAIQAEVNFSTGAEANAVRLEAHLKEVVKVARLLALLPGRNEYVTALLRLLADPGITRRGNEVTLQTRLSP
jgi:hypothetical protein